MKTEAKKVSKLELEPESPSVRLIRGPANGGVAISLVADSGWLWPFHLQTHPPSHFMLGLNHPVFQMLPMEVMAKPIYCYL